MGKSNNISGFTLVELAITVAIMLMLVSLSMSAFQRLKYGARESEAYANLNAIKTCQESYKAEHDSYLLCTASPDDIPSVGGADWDDNGGFENIGFNPGNKIRYQYSVAVNASNEFTATATGDVDGDRKPAIFQITEHSNIEKLSGRDVF